MKENAKNHKGLRTGAEALVEALERAGVEVVFGYPGGNVIDVFDAARTAKFRFVLGRHEQGCTHMADGYARALGRPGVVLVTSGPGLTNTITGLGCANMDGVPLVLVCGQVPLSQIGTDAFQEADTTGLTRAVSKHNFLVKSADEIPETVAQAFYIATHGKPGVVVIDVPRDCQRALTAAKFPERVSLRAYHPEVYATPREVTRLAKLLNEAKRPLVLAGGGVIAAEASGDVAALAHKAQIPVTTTMMGIGAIDERDPLALGMSGMYGTDAANRALREADVVLALGVRFNDRTTGDVAKFARQAKVVHVDCDPSSIDKNVPVALGIVADVKDLLTVVNSRILPAKHEAWAASLKRTDAATRGVAAACGGAIDPAAVVAAYSAAAKGEAIVVTDVGQHQLWVARDYRHMRPRNFLTSGGMGAMGFGIPAAIGAAIARPGERVVAFVGDGGAQMTFEELIVAAELKLDVTFVVFVNEALGLVRQMQKESYGGRYFATDLRVPDFVKLAQACGVKATRVSDPKALDAAVRRSLRGRGPTLLEVAVSKEACV
jgi:acetolactate synthase I/II/III large subunit